MLGHKDYARDYLQRASRITRYVPQAFAASIGLGGAWRFEWEDSITGAHIPVQAVRTNRLKACFGATNDDGALHLVQKFLDIRNLRAEEFSRVVSELTAEVVTVKLFMRPLNERVLQTKLGIIQQWFDSTSTFNQSASLLITVLKLKFIMHVGTFQGPEVISRLSLEFVHDVDNFPDPVKEILARKGLIER